MTQPAESPSVEQPSFPSYAAMRTAHTALLRLYRDKGAAPELLREAETFLKKGSATGAVIDIDDDRMGGQSLLDYWAAILSRADRPPTQTFLEEFDAEVVPTLPDELCPYVGLESFGESRRQLFFGRERVLKEMVERLREHRFLAVIGPLGSGKSSLVLGGLVPALKSGMLPGSDRWRYYPTFSPGADPLAHLARAVGALSAGENTAWRAGDLVRFIDDGGDQSAVIVVDGFEELFSVCQIAEKRDAFADALLGLVASPKRHVVLMTLRSDFEAQIAAVPQLHEPFERSGFRLPPLSASELRDTICGPAEQVGLKFEAGLVDRLVKEILGEPAGLPLLQFTLLKLWDRRDRNRVTLEAYRKIGGGRLALARAADELHDSLSPQDQTTLKAIVLLMVRPAAGMEVVTSSIRRAAAYPKADRASVDRVIDKLIAARLVRLIPGNGPGDQQLEMAHGALVWNWPRLVEWLDEERVHTRRRVRLTTAAEQWKAHGRDPGGLLGGSLLEEAKTYDDLTPFEEEFIAASATAAEAAVQEQEHVRNRELEHAKALMAEQKKRADEQTLAAVALTKSNRYLRGLTAVIVVLLIVAMTGWIVAERSRREAVRKQQTVEALMSGQGVVVEESVSRPTPGESEAAPAPTPAPPAASAPPTAGVAPEAGVASRIREATVDPEKTVSQIQLRAARRPTGRQIAGTELPAYVFTVWAEGPTDALQEIDSIQYEFNHPTFRQRLQTGRNRQTGFRVGYTGWGCLSSVVVTFRLLDASANPRHVDFDMCAAIEAEEQQRKATG